MLGRLSGRACASLLFSTCVAGVRIGDSSSEKVEAPPAVFYGTLSNTNTLQGWEEMVQIIRYELGQLEGAKKGSSIIVSMDWDQTLNDRGGTDQREETNQWAKEFCKFLDDNGIPWFVNTASDNIARAQGAFNVQGRTCSPFWDEVEAPSPPTGGDLSTGKRVGCIISMGYDKGNSILWALQLLGLAGENKVVLHVDDGALNLRNVAERTPWPSTEQPRKVILLFFPSAAALSPELDQEESRAWIDAQFDVPATYCDDCSDLGVKYPASPKGYLTYCKEKKSYEEFLQKFQAAFHESQPLLQPYGNGPDCGCGPAAHPEDAGTNDPIDCESVLAQAAAEKAAAQAPPKVGKLTMPAFGGGGGFPFKPRPMPGPDA